MGRPGRGGDDGPKQRHGNDRQNEQDQEQEAPTKEAPEPEHARAQNQYGNAALAAFMANNAAGDGGDGGAESEQAYRKVQDEEKSNDYGGEDEPVDDVPLDLFDLTQSWNPGISKTDDKAGFLEPMPDDELPPEDEILIRLVRTHPCPPIPASSAADPLIQPSTAIVARALTDWARAAARFGPPDPLTTLVQASIAPPAAFMQDPWGRVLMSRARAGAIATWMLVDTWAGKDLDLGATAFTSFCLELEGRRARTIDVRATVQDDIKRLARATKMFDAITDGRATMVQPRALARGAASRLAITLDLLLDMPSAYAYLPTLLETVDQEDDGNDPLDLDHVLQAFTGGPTDPLAATFDAAVQAAERMAGACARLRAHTVAVAVAVGDTCALWSAGEPTSNLREIAVAIDAEVDRNLKLLVEIARAAQQRAVQPRGLSAGLKRAAKAIDGMSVLARQLFSELIGGLLPDTADSIQAEPPSREESPLDLALATGNPHGARSWLTTAPPGPARELALLLLDGLAGAPADALADRALGVRSAALDQGSSGLAAIAGVYAGPGMLRAGRYDEAFQLGGALLHAGLARRNGLVIVDAALLQIEAQRLLGDTAGAHRTRLHAATICWHIGARGPLSLLARWHAPSEDA